MDRKKLTETIMDKKLKHQLFATMPEGLFLEHIKRFSDTGLVIFAQTEMGIDTDEVLARPPAQVFNYIFGMRP